MKQEINKKLKNKNIILFGVTETTIEFYERFRDVINISFCVTNYSENVVLQPMQEYDIETKLYDDVEITKDDFLVLCDYECYQPIERRLQSEGFSEYTDYVSSELAIGILEEKQIAVCMGSFLMKQIVAGLKVQEELANDFYFVFYPEYELLKLYKNRIAEYKHIARVCDLYIVSICDKNMYAAKVLSKEFLLDGCRIIVIPDINFGGYYLQMDEEVEKFSWFFYRERKRLDMPYRTLVLSREDSNLKRCVNDNMSVDDIIEYVSNVDFYSEEQVKQYLAESFDRLREIEKEADIPLTEFIVEKMKDTIVCRSLDEWDVVVIKYIIEMIARIIGIPIDNVDEKRLAEQIELESGSELPIYPSVLKHLNVIGYEDKKYKVVSFYKTQYLNFREYIRYVAECMYQVKDMNEFLEVGEGMYDD